MSRNGYSKSRNGYSNRGTVILNQGTDIPNQWTVIPNRGTVIQKQWTVPNSKSRNGYLNIRNPFGIFVPRFQMSYRHAFLEFCPRKNQGFGSAFFFLRIRIRAKIFMRIRGRGLGVKGKNDFFLVFFTFQIILNNGCLLLKVWTEEMKLFALHISYSTK